jgi:large subunit ribosomal protein L3
MVNGILGKKLGMTQVFDETGRVVPVTVIEAGPCVVTQIKTDKTDGYEAVQIAFGPQPKKRRVTQPVRGHFERAKVPYHRHLRELRLDGSEGDLKIGQVLTVELFAPGDPVRVTGITKGKGFQGGVRRWGYLGGPMTHGSMFHRAPGSIGASSYPSRVFPGHHMPGRMGGDRQTVRGLRVVGVVKEKHLLLVSGAVPGASGGLITIRKGRS